MTQPFKRYVRALDRGDERMRKLHAVFNLRAEALSYTRAMRRCWILALLAALLLAAPSARAPIAPAQQRARLKLVLVGDSTVTDRAGWGRAFKLFLDDSIECVNMAAGGRSSKSYIDEGRWREALAQKGDVYLIQFGHNDEPGKGPLRETDPSTTYRAYMSRYIDESRAIGARPVLVTSLARRTFREGRLYATLTPYVEAVRALAAEKQVPLIDLHTSSLALVERMGEDAWTAISPRDAKGEVDRTHLNAQSSLLVAPLVLAELRKVLPDLADRLRTSPATGAAAMRRAADAVVAQDGSGQYRTVQEAVNAVPQGTSIDRPWTVFIKAGTYRELVYVQREKRFLSLVGEDPSTTRITYDLHANMVGTDGKPIGTFRTPTIVVDADDFTAENLTFENAAGPVGQALALRVDADRAVFRNSRFLGWQDTIFINRGRQYFEDSFIAGHVDFIFGGATAYFERCHLHVWSDGYITAAATPPEQPHGYVFANGRITGEPGARTYLGRPWRGFARVAFINTEMSDVVRPEGWHNWDRAEREQTTHYAEFGSRGPGVASAKRVSWAKNLSKDEALRLTPREVLRGIDDWDPARFPASPSERKATAAPFPTAPGPLAASPPRVLELWPEGVPGAKTGAGAERVENGRVSNVHVPTLTMHAPSPSAAIGTALIVAPGGGYQRLAMNSEGGALVGKWNALGITVFVLKYRLAEYGHPAPLQDVLRAVRLVRSRAAEFSVAPDRIGIFGASAGGHLAASAAALHGNEQGRTGAALDAVSGRPDFLALLYPVVMMEGPFVHEGSRRNLLGQQPAAATAALLSIDKQVTAGMPPVFLVHTAEDKSVPVENSLALYAALRRAAVPVEMHLYEKGPHGFGTATGLGTTSDWPDRLGEWLRARGLLARAR